MMPRAITDADMAFWADLHPMPIEYTHPDPEVAPCPALQTLDSEPRRAEMVVRVAWQLDETEIANLAAGGTLWLSTWGGLPPHMLEVQAP